MHDGQPVRGDGVDHIAPPSAGLDARNPSGGIDLDFAVVRGELEQQGAVQRRQRLGEVAGHLRRDAEVVLARA